MAVTHTLILNGHPTEDAPVPGHKQRQAVGRGKDAFTHVASVLLHVNFLMKQKQTTIRKMKFLIFFSSQWQNHIAVMRRISSRSKILLFRVVKIPLHKHTEHSG